MFSILSQSRTWFSLSAGLVFLAIVFLVTPGLKMGIDFTGGSLMELRFDAEVSTDALRSSLEQFAMQQSIDMGQPALQSTTEGGIIVRTKELTNDAHVALKMFLEQQHGTFTETRFTTIGPTVGQSLRVRSVWAVLVAAVMMVLYIAFAFRNIPRKFNPWKFGVVAVVALLHDLIITIGAFALIGSVTAFEVNTLFVSALLIILGYSVNDTIVIFDRVRENIFEQQRGESFDVVAERGLQQSIARSVNTSLSTLIPLAALFFFGAESIRWFVLTLIIGLMIGTYSSLFLATPLLVTWRKQR